MKKIISYIGSIALIATTFSAAPVFAEDAPMENLGVVEEYDFEDINLQEISEIGYFLDGHLWIPNLMIGDSASIVEEADGNKALQITRKLENATKSSSKFVIVFDKAYTGKVDISFDLKIKNNNGSVISFMTPGSSTSTGASSELNSQIAANYWYTRLKESNGYDNWGHMGQFGDYWTPMTMTIDIDNGKFSGSTYRNYGLSNQSTISKNWTFSNQTVPDIKYFCVADINNNAGNLMSNRTQDAVYLIDNIKVSHYDYPTMVAESEFNGKEIDVNEAVEVSFNEAIAEEGLTKNMFILKCDDEAVENYNITASSDAKTISVLPENGWDYGKSYTLTVKKDVTAKRGKVRPMSDDFEIAFSVKGILGELNIKAGDRFNGSVTPENSGITGVNYSYQLQQEDGEYQDFDLSLIDEIGNYTLKIIAEKDGKTQISEVSFTVIGEVAPMAQNVVISGDVIPDEFLSGEYDFVDENGDAEGESEYRWLIASEEDGEYKEIPGATEKTLKVTDEIIDKFVKFEVTPVSAREPFKGEAVLSDAVKGLMRPTAKDVSIKKEDNKLVASYTYYDANGDEEDETKIEWYYQAEKGGKYEKIADAEGTEYTLSEKDNNRFISAMVISTSRNYPFLGEGVRTEAIAADFLPVATNLKIIGKAKVGGTIGAEYTYYDENDDAEGESLIKWYVNDSFECEGVSLNITSKHNGKKVYFTVAPVSKGSSSYGEEVKSETVTVSKQASGTTSGSGGGGGGSTPTTPVIPPKEDKPITNIPEKEEGFDDIKGHWAEKEIKELLEKGILKGVSENSFDPDGNLTRAQIAVILKRALNLQNGDMEFSDVSKHAWYYEGVASVGSVGLIMGSDGCFRPDDKITREELSTIIARMIDSEEKEYSLDNLEFSDKENISDWAVKGITVCYENAIVKGMENGEFMPKNPTTRAQAAVIISKVLQLKGGAENE